MIPLIFLVVLIIGLLIAAYRDVLTREVPDTLNFCLITVGIIGSILGAVIMHDINFFLEHLSGFLIGLGIGLAMFYARQWGGGDAKLLMGIGALIGFSPTNLSLIEYIVLLILCGAAYGVIVLLYLALIKHRKIFVTAFKKHIRTTTVHRTRIILVCTAIIGILCAIFEWAHNNTSLSLVIGLVIIGLYLMVYSWIFMRVVEQTLLIKKYPTNKLTEGDWVVEDIQVGKNMIVKGNTTGITLEQIQQLKKSHIKEVTVKEGIPFVPGFLIALLVLLLLQATIGNGWILSLI